jgi:cytochrome bd-type quinol oxidase subunit 1
MSFIPYYNNLIHPAVLISSIAIFHTFIAHFSIGMGLYVIVCEYLGYKKNNTALLEYTKRNSSLILFIATVLGALTGVGIWFVISIIAPFTTSTLIHNFVWFWASEWVFFVIEIVTILLYYYLWEKIDKKLHLIIGIIYFISGYCSLVLINGIISFQLTPGKWLETKNIWDGFFNPSFFPSTIARTGFCLILASVFSTFIISFFKNNNEIKKYTGKISTVFIVAGAIFCVVGTYMWVHSLPENVRTQLSGGNMSLTRFFHYYIITGCILIFLSIIVEFIFYKYINFVFAIILLCIGMLSFSYFEFTRERVRKPFLIRDYVYANGIPLDNREEINTKGILEYANGFLKERAETEVQKGELIYTLECYSCHSIKGFNNLKSKLGGLKAEDIYYVIDGIGYNPLMPPFLGTDSEKKYLATFLHDQLTKNK